MKTTPSAFGTSPKYDESKSCKFCECSFVVFGGGVVAKVNVARELQSQSQEELDALLPSVLDRAFKGEL